MNGKTREQLIKRSIIAACITAVLFLLWIVVSISGGGTSLVEILSFLLFAVLLFFMIFGFAIEPRMYWNYVKSAFTDMGIAIFLSIFVGIFRMFIGGVICSVKAFVLGIKGLAFIIKNR